MAKMQKKSMNSPDETRTFDKGKVDLTKIGDTSIGKMYLERGWSWESPRLPCKQRPKSANYLSGLFRLPED
jgi:hypothetical protein